MSRDLTDRELAKALHKHPRTIQRWAASGRLPSAYKAGRSWRIPLSSLSASQSAAAASRRLGALYEQKTAMSDLRELLRVSRAAVGDASAQDCHDAMEATDSLNAEIESFRQAVWMRAGRAGRDEALGKRRHERARASHGSGLSR